MFPVDVGVLRFLYLLGMTGNDLATVAIYKGTVNDPTKFPPPSKAHGSHHWAFERLVSASLVPLTAAAAVTSSSPYPVLDGILAITLVVHSHIGVRLLHLNGNYTTS